jgi:uncharacterized protein YkwD
MAAWQVHRPWPRGLSWIAAAALAVAGGLGSAAARADEPATGRNVADVAAILAAHNRERVAHDLAPLKLSPKLEAAALAHARDMAAHDAMKHEGSDGSTPAERIERTGYPMETIGENVARGARTSDEVMRVWIKSPEHHKNILGDFTELGAACVESRDGTPYWCVDLGRPWPALDPVEAGKEVVQRFNAERKKLNKPPLRTNTTLAAAAQRHARTMAEADKFVAKDDDGLTPFERVSRSDYRFSRLAEATASGQPSVEVAVQTWLDDRSNRESILGDFRDIGVGYAVTRKGRPYWCLLLGRPPGPATRR